MVHLTRSKRVVQTLTVSDISVSIDDIGTRFSLLTRRKEIAIGQLTLRPEALCHQGSPEAQGI
jgi:EAL domain-containing protein (putative c-di-GMP-specific phosphodiesterase class I)